MSRTRSHWDDVYERKPSNEVSWYQLHLEQSLKWIAGVASRLDAVIDVGAGASTLVDDLLDSSFNDITVLDVSGKALTAARNRLPDLMIVWHGGSRR